MLKWRIYISVVVGCGLTLFAHFTKELWFILSVVILVPGGFLTLLVSSHGFIWSALVANSLVYAGIAYLLLPRTMRKIKMEHQPFRAASIVTVAALAVLSWGWFGAKYYKESGRGSCRNQVVGELLSPDRQLKTVTFVRSCRRFNDEDHTSTHLSVLDSEQNINHADQGNIFAADSAHEAPVNERGAIETRVAWNSPTSINVQYPKVSRVHWNKTSYRNVSVKYETK